MSYIVRFLQQTSSQNYKKIQAMLNESDVLLRTYLSEFDMDSLDYLEFIMEIEEFYGINLDERAALNVTMLSDLDDLIKATKA